MYKPIDYEIFHIHTWRCKHAGAEEDFRYVESAIKLGAKRIVFTDHCPFPENPFGERMDMEQLPEYVDSIKKLKTEYQKQIEIFLGLEVEYLPSFNSYYKELHDSKDFDLLMIGQHFYENPDGSWSFLNEDKSKEFLGLADAMVQGAKTGLFDVIAHPDRMFRRCKEWNAEMMNASYAVIYAASENHLYLEQNFSSMRRKKQYWDPFWVRAGADVVTRIEGYDAHSVEEMEEQWEKKYQWLSQDELNKLLLGSF